MVGCEGKLVLPGMEGCLLFSSSFRIVVPSSDESSSDESVWDAEPSINRRMGGGQNIPAVTRPAINQNNIEIPTVITSITAFRVRAILNMGFFSCFLS